MADAGRLFAVFAHPDDETFLAGGTEAVRTLPARRLSEAAPDVRTTSGAGDPSSHVGRQEG